MPITRADLTSDHAASAGYPGSAARRPAAKPDDRGGPAEALPSVILVVEDDADIAATIRSGLQAVGYDSRWAADGPSALAALREFSEDEDHPGVGMVLLDWRLPNEPTGAALIGRLRGACSFHLPVVVISGDPTALAEAVAAGVEDYLPKPFLLEDLIHVVEEYSR